MTPSRFTKGKIATGYMLLLAVLFFSLIFVHQEMENLSASDDRQDLKSDSLLLLLREKDQNTIRMLRVLSEANDNTLSTGEIEEIIAEQDSIVTQQRVQHRVITKRDSLITKPQTKGFFKRVAEVFAPSKKDSATLVNTSLEFTTDTIIEVYNPADSLHQKIRFASKEKQEQKKTTHRSTNVKYRRLDSQLTARIDSLVKGYEQGMLLRASQEAEYQRGVRQRSARTIGGIAVGAVLLSVIFLMLIWRDMARSNRYRRELEEANQRAEELLEAREKLMLAITHDFKAPLGSIMGYTELLSRLTDDERQRFYLHNMKSSSEHLLKLVSDLLDFHRLDLNKAEVNRVTFHPSQFFNEIRVSFEPLTLAKGLTLRCEIAPQLDGHFISDPLRIRQIVTNLLSNAVKFTTQGEVALIARYSSSRLTIEVEDTGQGMAIQDRERIFQEFTRLPGAQGEEGFGLGLSIVRKLVALLEGDINVQSTLGEGSRFIITLPLYPVGHVEATAEPTNHVLQSVEASVPPNLHILLIDDDKIQLTLTAAMLQQHGITTVCCEQLEELTAQLRSGTFDLLLTDVQMPAINGFDLLKLLRASNIPQARTIPIIAVTARSEMKREEFLAHGFVGSLHKPFSVHELLSVIDIQSCTPPCRAITDTNHSLHFSALTAFSEDDVEAARSIIHTFIEETEKNRTRMAEALAASNVSEVAAMAHKLLPLLTLIGASQLVELLTWLEACRGESTPSEEFRRKTEASLSHLVDILEEANNYSTGQEGA